MKTARLDENGKNYLRNPDMVPEIPYRSFMREHFPAGPQGLAIEDIDLLVRSFGKNYNSDDAGRFFLVECKYGRNHMGYAQLRTFGLLDNLLRQADPNRDRYLGFYILQYDNEDWGVANFRVNGNSISRDDFLSFMQFQSDIEPYKFPVQPFREQLKELVGV